MKYWYRFKVKGAFDIDIKDAKNEEEAEDKAYDIAEKLIKEMSHLQVLEYEIDERGEWED